MKSGIIGYMCRVSLFYFFMLVIGFISCKSGNGDQNESLNETIHQEIGHPEIDRLTKEIMTGKKDSELYFSRAQAYAEIEAYDNAISDMFVSLKIDSLQPKYYYFLSDVYLNYYRSSQALATMQRAHDLFPDNHDAALKYAELLITLKQDKEAIRVIDGVMIDDDQNAQAFFLMGYLMSILNDKAKAISSLKHAVELDPDIVDGYLILAELHADEEPALALQYFDNAILVSNRSALTLHNKAYFLQNQDDIQGALKIYDEIKEIDPQYTSAFLNSGILQLERDSLDAAFDNFNILIKIEPSNHVAYFYRGLTQALQGSDDLARKDYEQALIFKPDYKNAQEALAKLDK